MPENVAAAFIQKKKINLKRHFQYFTWRNGSSLEITLNDLFELVGMRWSGWENRVTPTVCSFEVQIVK